MSKKIRGMKTMTNQERRIDNLTGAIISSQIALNYNERLKYTSFYKHGLKNALNRSIKELIKTEEAEYDKIYQEDPDQTHNISANLSNTIKLLMEENSFIDLILLGNMMQAYKQNPKAIEGIIKKVLINKQ